MGKDSIRFVEQNGETGVLTRKKDVESFKSMLSGTLDAVKWVNDPEQKLLGGIVVTVKHAWFPDRRKDGDMLTAEFVQFAGLQPDGTLVLSNSMAIKDGAVLCESESPYYLPASLILPHASIPTPLDNDGRVLFQLYDRIKGMYGRSVFLNFLMAGGAALKGLHYNALMEYHQRIGITIMEGSYNTGKSLSARVALSCMGMSASGMFSVVSPAQQRRLPSHFALPICFNDVKKGCIIEQVALASFERGTITSCIEDAMYRTSPMLTCNRDVLNQLQKKMRYREYTRTIIQFHVIASRNLEGFIIFCNYSPRELSRLAIICFDESLPNVPEECKTLLDQAMKEAGNGVQKLVAAGTHLLLPNGMRDVRRRLEQIMPKNDWEERLLHVYSLDLWCAYVFARAVGHSVEIAELIDHFQTTSLKEVTCYQGFVDPYNTPITTLVTLMRQAIAVLTVQQLRNMVTVAAHSFGDDGPESAVCLKLSGFLKHMCPLDKGRFQTALRNTLDETDYATGKQRFVGAVSQCTMLRSTLFGDVITDLKTDQYDVVTNESTDSAFMDIDGISNDESFENETSNKRKRVLEGGESEESHDSHPVAAGGKIAKSHDSRPVAAGGEGAKSHDSHPVDAGLSEDSISRLRPVQAHQPTEQLLAQTEEHLSEYFNDSYTHISIMCCREDSLLSETMCKHVVPCSTVYFFFWFGFDEKRNLCSHDGMCVCVFVTLFSFTRYLKKETDNSKSW
ncbi:hypothetical protein HOLleu_30398 [Holothuria leucospilota]|uniref:Uncharacterized protein n=1 Tax=Holothuria leucospilota TaxID=206669 RepID=A0A9Q1BKL5_HOLLE|nr:hypothetical protein HOLleu_30398 [Holothuria leucospilota]